MNTVTAQLRERGFDVKVWPALSDTCPAALQITDGDGITFYMPETATFKECLIRYAEKLDEFNAATK